MVVGAANSDAIRDCLADACLDGEADQIEEVLRRRRDFEEERRKARTAVEAELSKLADCLWDIDSALGEYEQRRVAAAPPPFEPLKLDEKVLNVSSPSNDGRGADSPVFQHGSPSWTARRKSEPHHPRPPEAKSPAARGVPQFRRYVPLRSYQGHASNLSPSARTPPEEAATTRSASKPEPFKRGSDFFSHVHDPGGRDPGGERRAASKPESRRPDFDQPESFFDPSDMFAAVKSPNVNLRRVMASRLQENLQRRKTLEGSEDGGSTAGSRTGDDDFLDGSKTSSTSSTASQSRPNAREAPEDGHGEEDWYVPPDIWSWNSASNTAYCFSPPRGTSSYTFKRGECSSSASAPRGGATAAGGGGGSAAPRPASRGGARPPPSPRMGATGVQPPPRAAPPPAPPRPGANASFFKPGGVGGFGTSPTAGTSGGGSGGAGASPHAPGMRARWWREFGQPQQSPGSTGCGASTSTGQPPPSRPKTSQPPPPSRPGGCGAGAAASARTALEATAVAKLEVRLQELRHLPREDQRKVTKELMVQWHPDKNPTRNEEATRVFQWLQNRKKEVLGF